MPLRISVASSFMYVCVCKAVTDHQVRDAVSAGVRNVRQLTLQTGLGSCCGRCVPEARALIEAALAESAVPGSTFAATPIKLSRLQRLAAPA